MINLERQVNIIQNFDDRIALILNTEDLMKSKIELQEYFFDGFGSYERIDYGSGHEMNFFAFLFCLYKIGVISDDEIKIAMLRIFNRYLILCRRLQTIYMLEPAGSHGVWGLDDYQFLSFLIGAGQLVKNPMLTPDSIHTELDENKDEYMYFGCIDFIKSVKKGVPFGESSPMLNDISAVGNWGKLSQGMIKMYQAEVLGKMPVIKHFRFGSLLKFP